jgi:hypothetical protein
MTVVIFLQKSSTLFRGLIPVIIQNLVSLTDATIPFDIAVNAIIRQIMEVTFFIVEDRPFVRLTRNEVIQETIDVIHIKVSRRILSIRQTQINFSEVSDIHGFIAVVRYSAQAIPARIAIQLIANSINVVFALNALPAFFTIIMLYIFAIITEDFVFTFKIAFRFSQTAIHTNALTRIAETNLIV